MRFFSRFLLKKTSVSALVLLVAFAASSAIPPAPRPIGQQRERDLLYSWLAYAVVYQDWQTTSQPDSSRGFNIGSVLVNADGYVVYGARNAVNATRNYTQHGEVRLVQGYLRQTRQFSLKDYTVYTTLEPCAMCAGMMTLTQVRRVVYGQTDPDYGATLERLQLDSRGCTAGGYKPYPRLIEVTQAPDPQACALDSASFQRRVPRITQFLTTAPARRLYEQATAQLAHYTAQHPANQVRLDSARRFLARMPKQFTE